MPIVSFMVGEYDLENGNPKGDTIKTGFIMTSERKTGQVYMLGIGNQ